MSGVRAVLFLFCFLDAVLAFQLIWGGKGAMEYVHLRTTSVRLQAEIDSLDSRNMLLSEDIRRLKSTPEYLERVVRTELNFVGDNEILYVFDPISSPQLPGDSHP